MKAFLVMGFLWLPFLTKRSNLPSLSTLTACLVFIYLVTRSVVVLLSVSCPSITFDQNGSNQFGNSETQMGSEAKNLRMCSKAEAEMPTEWFYCPFSNSNFMQLYALRCAPL